MLPTPFQNDECETFLNPVLKLAFTTRLCVFCKMLLKQNLVYCIIISISLILLKNISCSNLDFKIFSFIKEEEWNELLGLKGCSSVCLEDLPQFTVSKSNLLGPVCIYGVFMPATPPVPPIAPPKVTRTIVQLIKHLSVRNVELTERRRVKETGKEQTKGEVLTEVRRLELKLTWAAEGWRRGHVFCVWPDWKTFVWTW